MGESQMLAPGVYYFWLKKRDVRGEYAIMITQQVIVKLNRRVCPQKQFAFRARVHEIKTRLGVPVCFVPLKRSKEGYNAQFVKGQLRKIAQDVKQSAPLDIFIADLRPLEGMAYWSKNLQELLEDYAKIEAKREESAVSFQKTWLCRYITTNKVAFDPTVVRWGRMQGTDPRWQPLFIYRDLTTREEWIFQCFGIQKGRTRWQWQVPWSAMEQRHETLSSLLPGISNFLGAIAVNKSNFVWGQRL